MDPRAFLEFGSLGLLGIVLWWIARSVPPLVKSLVDSISSLTVEVSSFRKQQEHFSKLLMLLLSRELGQEKAVELLKEGESDNP